MWTYLDNWTLLPNINVKHCYKDGVLKMLQRYPADGYVLHIPSGDTPIYDEEGNEIGIQPYYTYGGATCRLNYDFTTNPNNYHADLYEEGMEVFGGGNNDHEVM